MHGTNIKNFKWYLAFCRRGVQFDRPSSFNEGKQRKNWKHLYDIPKD